MFSPDRAGCARRRRVPHRTRLTFAIALSVAALTACAVCGPADAGKVAAKEAAKAAEVDTEHLFGFVEGADIGSKGEKEFLIDSNVRAGKSSGTFADATTDLEIKYTALENFRISTTATLGYYDIAGVTGIENTRRAAIQSLSFDARFRVLDRTQAPLA